MSFPSLLFLVLLLLSTMQCSCLELQYTGVRGGLSQQREVTKTNAKIRKAIPASKGRRSLKSSKSSKVDTLRAKIESEDSDWDDLEGYVYVYFDGDEMDISYDLEDLPEKCKDDECYIAIHKGDCDDLDGKYHRSGNQVWDEDDTGFTTNKNGRAAGMLFGLESGYDAEDNICRALVIYGPEDESDDDIDVIGCGMLVPDDEDFDYCD